MLLKKLEDMEVNVIDELLLLNYYPYQQTTNYVFKIYRQIKEHIKTILFRNRDNVCLRCLCNES